MFPFYDNLNVRVTNEGERPFKMGFSTIMPGETVDVSAKHLTAPLLMRAERSGVKYDGIVIGGKLYDLVEREKPELVDEKSIEKAEVPEAKEEPASEPGEAEGGGLADDGLPEAEAPEVEDPEELDLFGEPEEKALKDMSKKELVEKAKELGINTTGLNKGPLIDAIEEAQ